jgi:hypothetical protein
MAAGPPMSEEAACTPAAPAMPEAVFMWAAPPTMKADILAAPCMGAGACMLAAGAFTPGAALPLAAEALLLEAGATLDVLTV